MKRFKSAKQAQRFLSAFGPISGHFQPRRHRLSAGKYRAILQDRFLVWNEVTRGKQAASFPFAPSRVLLSRFFLPYNSTIPFAPTNKLTISFRLIPKGERTQTPQDYFIGEETKRILVKVAQMLAESYHLQGGETLPSVPFNPHNKRSHRFGTAPYLFQYHHHLSDHAISACLRFLLHGMIFQTREGKRVVLKPHLLRHAFATHAVQVEKIPLDIVGEWLKQKSLDVTDYYSQPTESMIADAVDLYLGRVSVSIQLGKAVHRSPQELQQVYHEAKNKAGTLADVIGGQCVSHGFCAAKFACVGCPGKVPDPAKRLQLEKHKVWALQQVTYATEEGLLPEAERMRQLARDCETELQEIDAIEAYRKDEERAVRLRLEARQ